MTNQEGSTQGQMIVLSAMAVVLLISLITFLLAGRVMGLMGETVSTVLTRVLGIILAALAAQFIIGKSIDFLRANLKKVLFVPLTGVGI